MNLEHQGETFAAFLDELGIREDIENQAVKAILADQICAAMATDRLSKSAMATRMNTSRRAPDRLLDPEKQFGSATHAATGRQCRRPPAAVGVGKKCGKAHLVT